MKILQRIGESWYGTEPRDRRLFARVIAVAAALIATHSTVGAIFAFIVLDYLLE